MVHDGSEAFCSESDIDLYGCKAFFQELNQIGIDGFLCCSVSLLSLKQGILVAPEFCEATGAPSQQSFLASALERLWR